jgi:hypothetical protein
MTSSIDSNVLAALWDNDHPDNVAAVKMLDQALRQGKLVVTAPVYSELMAGPLGDEAKMDRFFSDTGISVEWKIDEDIWREAGRAYSEYARRRIRSGGGPSRRILADFIIGAHAAVRGYTLLTLNSRDYAAAFPKLKIISM